VVAASLTSAVLDTLRSELERTMALCGVTDLYDVPGDLVSSAPGGPCT
jgi:isopentenyl diphosphate isomerase/L-lactate dehydrogenase-like FMN-dependent dehydrogenase